MTDFLTGLFILFIVALIGGAIWGIGLIVIPFQTSQGEHTGYVTAIETNGIFLKTTSAYVKTDTMSSQEDIYCVIDKDVIAQLQQFAANKTHVDLYYVDWLKKGMQNCNDEPAIITKAVAIQ